MSSKNNVTVLSNYNFKQKDYYDLIFGPEV